MIGILPAAGTATRIHGLPKYLLPVPGGYLLEDHKIAMLIAGCNEVLIGGNHQNSYLLDRFTAKGSRVYEALNHDTMTQTVLSARWAHDENWHQSESVLFGMPDTYFDHENNPYFKLAKRLQTCDVAIAVFRTRPGQHSHGGMVSFSHNRVTEVIDKPVETNLQYIWGALAWKPAFWDCLTPDMPHVGYGLPVAIERGLDVRAVICDGGFWDCGTPDEYFECIRALTGESVHAS